MKNKTPNAPKEKAAETRTLRLAVVGGRKFRDDRLMDAKLTELDPTEVISGGADGADRMGETWARRRGVPTRIFHPEPKKYKHPFHHRNRLIAEACDILIAFWDGSSSGTRYTIGYARKIGKTVIVVRY